jgi:hypothetical protein
MTQYKKMRTFTDMGHGNTLIDNLYPVSKKELKDVCKVLGDAFSKDPLMEAWNLKGEEIDTCYEMFIRYCLRYGNVYATSEKFEGIMAILPSKYGIMTAWPMIRSGAIFPAMKIRKKFTKEMQETLKVLDEEKKNFEIHPHMYLAVLGVSQKNQRKGYGGKMLRALIEMAENQGLPIYFETQTEGNVVFYKKLGFEVMKEIELPNFDVYMWYMVRKNIDFR